MAAQQTWLRSHRHAAFLAAVALEIALSATAGADLLTNGNFNTDTDGVAGPDNWTSWTYGPTSFAAYKNDAANDPFDLDGTPYVNAGNYGDWWSSGGGWYQQVAGTGGTPYTITAASGSEGWDNAAGELRIIYFDSSGTELQRDVRHTADYQASLPWTMFTRTSIAPANAVSVKAELATWGARGCVLWDDVTLETASVWNVDAGGDFAQSSNWLGGTPGGVDAAARFLDAISDNRTVAIDSAVTLGSISFVNAKTYLLSGAGSLRLERTAGTALIDVQSGTQSINLPLTLASNTSFVVSTDATLKISDPLTIAAGKSLQPRGAGTILYESSIALEAGASISFNANAHPTALSLASTAHATIAAHGSGAARVLTVDSLAVAPDATLDVADNTLVVQYAGASPLVAINNLLASGYNAGLWTGPGITSSAAIDGQHGVGAADSGTAVTVKIGAKGDTNLDGLVNFDDLLKLAQSYNVSGTATWAMGDSNYDHAVNFDDLLALAQNYSSGAPGAMGEVPASIAVDWAMALTLVPEPTSLGCLGLAMGILRRRR